ncbi:MAG: YjjG family noncanonical pyrimidine nucleotidase [Bacteroidales bacterium]
MEVTKKKYRHLFFDLDRTLYDFDKSTRITFESLFEKFHLHENGVTSLDVFLERYRENNRRLWDRYRKGEIKKKFLNVERFHVTLLEFGINDRAFAGRFAADYVRLSPQNRALFPGVDELLNHLHGRYRLHIITNGFEEVQNVKLEANEIVSFFDTVTTSEEAGAKKPDARIFKHALGKAGALPGESLMIGDDYDVDIRGARAMGIDQIWYAPDGHEPEQYATWIVSNLTEVLNIL